MLSFYAEWFLYRLRYLPLNGFVSSPCIKFDANVYLNYLSYPLLYQLTSQVQYSFIQDQRNILAYGYVHTYFIVYDIYNLKKYI